MVKLRWLSVLGLFASSPAWAWVWFDDPSPVVVWVDRSVADLTSAAGELGSIRMHACGGGSTDYPVGQTVDLTDPLTVLVDGGYWCGLSLRWASAVTVTNGAWVVEYAEVSTPLAIDENPEAVSVPLTPFEVTSGTFSGLAPRVYATVGE